MISNTSFTFYIVIIVVFTINNSGTLIRNILITNNKFTRILINFNFDFLIHGNFFCYPSDYYSNHYNNKFN